MSDGNFNRSLLPHTQYGSGMRAGKSMAKMKTIEAFSQWLEQEYPDASEQTIQEMKASFTKILDECFRVI